MSLTLPSRSWSIGALSVAALVVACGGGGGSATTPPPPPPPTSKLFTDVTATHVPSGLVTGRCMDAQAFDYDGDLDADLLLVIENGTNVMLRNDGNAVFTSAAAGMLGNAADHEDAALADFDGDGDLDLAIAAEDTQLHEYYLDDGTTFLGTNLVWSSVANAALALDVDADGDLDLLFGGNVLLVLINDGSGAFATDAPGRFVAPAGVIQDLVAVDVDGDLDLDLALGNEGQNQLFLNQGAGVWSDATATHLPAVIDETRVLAFADVDGDGDDDLFVGNVLQQLTGVSPQNALYANDGSGRFATSGSLLLGGGSGTYGGRFVDFDADGDPDLVTANADILDPTHLVGFQLRRNDGSGAFTDITTLAFGGPVLEHGFGVAAADFDGDNDVDLYLCARGANLGPTWHGQRDHLMLQD